MRSPSPISIRSEPERSESPEPSSAHIDHSSIAAQYQGTDALSETPHNNAQAEQDFHTWNNNLSNHYASYLNNLPGNTDSGSAHFPLYRAAMETPSEIFQERGELKSSTQLKKEAFDRMGRPLNPDETQHFSLARHQVGKGTAYTSMTRSLPFAAEFAGTEGRPYVYITDPQPHGRDLNAVNLSRGKRMGEEEDDNEEGYMKEQEVSVPGSIHSSEIRGAIPINDNGEPDFTGLMKNPHYKSPRERFGNRPNGSGTA
jgi:hypothetical protein